MTCYDKEDDNIYIGEHDVYRETHVESANAKLIQEACRIFLTYNDVEFYYVAKEVGLMPEAYNWTPNVKEINYNQYFNLAGLGAIAH